MPNDFSFIVLDKREFYDVHVWDASFVENQILVPVPTIGIHENDSTLRLTDKKIALQAREKMREGRKGLKQLWTTKNEISLDGMSTHNSSIHTGDQELLKEKFTFQEDSSKTSLWRRVNDTTHHGDKTTHMPQLNLKLFRNLPEELQEQILQRADTKGIAYLSLLDRGICRIAREIIQRRYQKKLGTWAGKRLFFMFLKTREPTQGDATARTYADSSQREESPDDGDWTVGGCASLPRVFGLGKSVDSIDFFHDIIHEPEECNIYRGSSFYPVDRVWILRNLTTREYVRGDALNVRETSGPFYKRQITFGDIVALRAVWTTPSDLRHGTNQLGIQGSTWHRGPWAGHAFDIVTTEHHESTKTQTGIWNDVSEEVMQYLVKKYMA